MKVKCVQTFLVVARGQTRIPRLESSGLSFSLLLENPCMPRESNVELLLAPQFLVRRSFHTHVTQCCNKDRIIVNMRPSTMPLSRKW